MPLMGADLGLIGFVLLLIKAAARSRKHEYSMSGSALVRQPRSTFPPQPRNRQKSSNGGAEGATRSAHLRSGLRLDRICVPRPCLRHHILFWIRRKRSAADADAAGSHFWTPV